MLKIYKFMRKIKKYFKNVKTLYNNKSKINDVKENVKQNLGDITFQFASFGGADINYYVLKDKKKFAMMRLAIVDIKKDNDRPILRFHKEKRFNKEYKAYSVGAKYGLTPQVLYRSKDALVCEYIGGERVFNILKKDKSQVWNILTEVVGTYRKLHDLGITHLDATLKNFVLDNNQMKVIDFEYYPGNTEFSLEEQKAYDYVRIIEHTLRIIPEKYQGQYHQFIEDLDKIVPSEIRDVDFYHVKPWIINIQTFPIFDSLKEQIFINLTFK